MRQGQTFLFHGIWTGTLMLLHASRASSTVFPYQARFGLTLQSAGACKVLGHFSCFPPSRLTYLLLFHQVQLWSIAQSKVQNPLSSPTVSEETGIGLLLCWPQGQLFQLLQVEKGSPHTHWPPLTRWVCTLQHSCPHLAHLCHLR